MIDVGIRMRAAPAQKDDGEAELAAWLRTPPDLSSPPRDELVIKILIAVEVPTVDVHQVIQAHRRYLVQLMQEWTRLKEDDNGSDLAFSLVVDSELFRLDSVVRWLDAAEGRLRRALADGWTPTQAFPARGAGTGLPTRPTMGARR